MEANYFLIHDLGSEKGKGKKLTLRAYRKKIELFVFEVRRAHQLVDVWFEVGLRVHADDRGNLDVAAPGAKGVGVVAAFVQRLLIAYARDAR